MRKLTVLVAMLVMVLAAAAPAFAQTAVDGSVAIDNSTSVTYDAVAQNVVGDIETGDAIQRGDATATATNDSVARASIDADLDTSVSLSNEVGHWDGDWDDWSWWWF
jgi:hypothetical protein